MSEHVLIDTGPAFEAAGLIHRVHPPAAGGARPTAVLLHGLGGDEDGMWLFSRTLPARKDWLIIAPRGPATAPNGGYAWRNPGPSGAWPTLADFDRAAGTLARFISSLPDLYPADPAQVYLAGFSQGAAAAFATAARHPGLIRGIAALMGFLPQPAASAAGNSLPLAGLPVFMAAGQRDQVIPLELSRTSARAIQAAGARLEYHEYDARHKMSAEGMADLKRWWKAVAARSQLTETNGEVDSAG